MNTGRMLVRNILLFLLCFCGIFAAPSFVPHAQALEMLMFGQKTSKSSNMRIHKYLAAHSTAPDKNIEIAPIDLNDDGLNEFIVKHTDCRLTHQFCRFDILAENGAEIISIGGIEAKAIAVDTKQSQGIRNLLALQTPSNDYARTLYVWDAAHSRYILSE